jgi:hypothetical protein
MAAHPTNYGPADLLLLGAAMILALAFGLVGMAILNGKHSTRCPIHDGPPRADLRRHRNPILAVDYREILVYWRLNS